MKNYSEANHEPYADFFDDIALTDKPNDGTDRTSKDYSRQSRVTCGTCA